MLNKDQRRQKRKAKKRLRKVFLPRFVACHYLRLPQIIPPTEQDLLDAYELARERDKWLKLPFQEFPDIPSEEHQCWRNVERVIAEHGGAMQCGWYISLSSFPLNRNSMNDIEMIPHGVWCNPAGALIEVSHDCRGGLFVASSVVVPFKGMNVGFVDTEFYARTYRPLNPALQSISGNILRQTFVRAEAMLKEINIAAIKIGSRHRKDLGDLMTLAESIRQEGLLQPIGVTDRLELVFGERRIRAVRDTLKKKTILARIVNVSSIIAGEYAENEVRKDFTPPERVAIAKAIEQQIGNRRGQWTDKERVQKIAQVDHGQKTHDTAAKRAGFGNHETYRQAAKVVESGTPRLIQAMDSDKVSISAASILADADAVEQEAVLELDEKAILQAAKEIRRRQAERRAKDQEARTLKPQARPRKERLRATQLIHGDCRGEMPKLASRSIDLILADPPYPEIDREYGRLTENEWHALMRAVVIEGRWLLRPTGSMVVILQPNFEKVGRMRLWLWEFVTWAGREWNLVEDAYWWLYDAVPLSGTKRSRGLLRSSVKMYVWLGASNCYRNQDNVLWLPSDVNFAESREDRALRRGPSGRTCIAANMTETVEARGGSTPFNLLPITAGANASDNGHPGKTPYDVAAWWVKYLLPPGGVLLDCFAGSGTMLVAGLDFGASQVIGIEKEKKYLRNAEKRIVEG